MSFTWQTRMSRDNATLHLYRLGRKNRVKLAVLEAYELVDAKLLGHLLCGGGADFVYRIPVGRPKYYADDPTMLENSLGSVLYNSFGRLYEWATSTEEEDEVLKLQLTEEQARALSPDSSWWDDDEDED